MQAATTNLNGKIQQNKDAGKIRVFLVDDHTIFRESLAMLLDQEAHFEVVGHIGDERAVMPELRLLQPDVVILDLSMPKTSGLDIFREIKREMPTTGVIILSMHSDEQMITRAIHQGVSGYVLKGSGVRNLKTAIDVAFQGGTYLCPGIPKDILQNSKPPKDPIDYLSDRENQVLQLFTQGKTNKEMATVLALSPKTIDTYRRRVMQKLEMPTQSALMRYAIERGVRVDPTNK